jgi:hypothetical protein
MSEIKWAYNEQTGSFSALPASAFLLPVLVFIGLLPFIEKLYNKQKFRPQPLPLDFDKDLHQKFSIRYKELKSKQLEAGLTINEQLELQRLTKPPWSKPGEYWHYD